MSIGITLQEFLIKFTAIPIKFIEEYIKFYNMCKIDKFGIKVIDVINYLGVKSRKKFEERLRNIYIVNKDYIIHKENKQLIKGVRDAHYMLSFDGFEKIALRSSTKKGEMFRDYFIMLRKFIDYYKQHIADKIMELTQTNKFMYIILVNKNKNIFKIGRTGDIRKRLMAYSTGKESHPDVKFIMIVNDDKKVEKCTKLFIKVKQFKANKELYQTDFDYLKKTIYNCAELDDNLKIQIEKDDKFDSYVVFDDNNTIEYLQLNDNGTGHTKVNTIHKTTQKHHIMKSNITKTTKTKVK
jgi:phage anti-repressor protein